ncbi:acyl-CoA thioesterase [Thiolapillus sp.]
MKSFQQTFQVPFHELDPGGVMFHAHLFSHAHNAYAALLSEAGHSLKTILASDYLLPLAHAEADYLHPLLLDDEVRITVFPASVGNSALHFSYEFHKEDMLCATAATSHVFLCKASKTPVAVPENLRQNLLAYSS